MASEIKAEGATRTQPAKRSLFKKPAWSQAQPVEEEGLDLFSRSSQVYAEVVHEQEDRRRKKLARSANRVSQDREKSNEPGRKKRRIDGEDARNKADTPIVEIDSDDSVKDTKYDAPICLILQELTHVIRKKQSIQDSEDSILGSPSHSRVKISPPSTRRDGESINGRNTASKASISAPIELSDDDEEPAVAPTRNLAPEDEPVHSTGGAAQDEEPMSDEEFPELARQARARARAKQLEKQALTTSTNHLGSDGVRSGAGMSRPGATSAAAPTPEPDVKVDILITSQIPDTQPLIVQRRTHQDLRDVRFAWCSHQGFDSQKSFDIFLTWRGKRLFDVTTCKSLGIGVNSNSGALLGTDNNWLGEENLQVHMVAMTEAMFEASKKGRRSGKTYGEEDRKETGGDEGDPPPEEKEEQIRIILKGKGYEDFKLIVKPVCGSLVDDR